MYRAAGASLNQASAERENEGAEKGVRNLLPERPAGCFAQKIPDPFFH